MELTRPYSYPRGRGWGIPFSLSFPKIGKRKQDPQFVVWLFNTLKALFPLVLAFCENSRRRAKSYFLSTRIGNCGQFVHYLRLLAWLIRPKRIARYWLATMVRGVPLTKVRPTDTAQLVVLSTQIQNIPPLVPGADSLRRRQNLNHPGAR